MYILLRIKDLIEEADDLTFDKEELEILGENYKDIISSAAKYSYIGSKKLASISVKGVRGIKSWLDYLNSIERYKELIDKTESRILNNSNSDREKELKLKLDKYRY